jgi:hypothetical protein
MANKSAATAQAREAKIRVDLLVSDIVVFLPKKMLIPNQSSNRAQTRRANRVF